MSAFDTPWFKSQDGNFFQRLDVHPARHVIVTGETDDFAEDVLKAWREAGFDTRYVPAGSDEQAYIAELHGIDQQLAIGATYAVIAFGDAAAVVLRTCLKRKSPTLAAIIAYYPSSIPVTALRSPSTVKVMLHLAGDEINVQHQVEVLGIQSNKLKAVRKRIDSGVGIGETLPLGCRTYLYSGCESGFAEHDLDDYESCAEQLAFSRSLSMVKQALRVEEDLETVRDAITDAAVRGDAEAAAKHLHECAVIDNVPSSVKASGSSGIQAYFNKFLHPLPPDYSSKLLSRTVGSDRVVDEVSISFTHSRTVPWLLPDVPPSGRKVNVVIVSISCIRAGKLHSEHVYWDHASVLRQIGLLDPSNRLQHLRKNSGKKMPVNKCK